MRKQMRKQVTQRRAYSTFRDCSRAHTEVAPIIKYFPPTPFVLDSPSLCAIITEEPHYTMQTFFGAHDI